jgi:apolipoprotein N-acyltransferase
MPTDAQPPLAPARPHPALALAVAALLLPFAIGASTIAAAAWLAPVFMLRFTRTARFRFSLVPAWAVLFVSFLFQFRGVVPMPTAGVVAVGAAASLLGLLAYALDRWANRVRPGFVSTLVFPCAVAAIDFSTRVSPYGSWGVLGYSQFGNLPIMQFASVAGIYGISFLVAWLGPVVNWAWEEGFAWHRLRQGVTVFVAVVGGVYALGCVRLIVAAPGAGTVRVAGIAAGDNIWTFLNQSVQDRFWSGQPLNDAEMAPVRADMARKADRLLEQSEHEAQAGARVVFWSEGGAWILKQDEPRLIAKGSALAAKYRIYLGMALISFDPAQSPLRQNKLVLIGPDGKVCYEYWKSRAVPGDEQATMEVNGNPMRYTDTSTVRLGSFICYDLDFPSLVLQAGRERTDLLIVPANDWAAIDPLHTHMSVFRAVENGSNLVRAVSNGRSLAVDFLGRTLAETDYFTGSDRVIVANVPVHGVGTVYAEIGDLFAWICVAALVALLSARLIQWRKERSLSGLAQSKQLA